MNKLVLFLAAIFSTFLCVPSHAQVIVGNFGVNYVTATPSGPCSSNAPIESVIGSGEVYSCQDGNWAEIGGGGSSITLTTTGTSGAATLVDGVLNIPVYSGGGGTPAGVNGNPQINASGSFGAASNVIYQQSGDTIASIETACSSPCTYVVTSPQTITLAASHAMNSNVWVQFGPSGKWTVNGAFTLSNVQVADGSALTQHFAGSSTVTLSALNSLVPVEWFGASTGASGSANLTAIQAAINALSPTSFTGGQVELQSGIYTIAGTLTYTTSGTGMAGQPSGSFLEETTAGDGGITVTGTSGTPLSGNKFNNFEIYSEVTQTGTTAGFLATFTSGLTVQKVEVQDFFYPFSIHASTSSGGGGFYNDTAVFTSLSSAMTSPIAFYLPSTDGNAENSVYLADDGALNLGGPASAIGMELYGTAINDVRTKNFGTAGMAFGQIADFTGSASTAAQDIHFIGSTHDTVGQAFLIENLPLSSRGTVTIEDAWASGVGGTTSLIDCESSYGLIVADSQIQGPSGIGVLLHNCTGAAVTGNSIVTSDTETIELNGTTDSAITGNKLYQGTGTLSFNSILVTGNSTFNNISGNAISGFSTAAGIAFDSGSNNNNFQGNTIDTTHITTAVNNSYFTNGSPYPVQVNFSNASVSNFLAVGTLGIESWSNSTPSDAWAFGYAVPAGSVGTNLLGSVYGGSTWQQWLSVNSTTLATAFAGAVTAPGYISGGTTFTASGCTNSTLVGGATAGSYDSGTTGTCTVTVTMGGSLTAPHGWSCSVHDLTTPADTQQQTATAAGTATFSGTTVSGDVVNFGCIGY